MRGNITVKSIKVGNIIDNGDSPVLSPGPFDGGAPPGGALAGHGGATGVALAVVHLDAQHRVCAGKPPASKPLCVMLQ